MEVEILDRGVGSGAEVVGDELHFLVDDSDVDSERDFAVEDFGCFVVDLLGSAEEGDSPCSQCMTVDVLAQLGGKIHEAEGG